MSAANSERGRWFNYLLLQGQELKQFFGEHLGTTERAILFVLARSFDPRTPLGLRMLMAVGGEGRRDVRLLVYKEAERSGNHDLQSRAEENFKEIMSLIEGRGEFSEHIVEFYSDGRRVASQRAADAFSSTSEIELYTDIVVDVSGMPRSVFFPLVARILHLIDEDRATTGRDTPNLFLLVAEDPNLDAEIAQEGIEEFADFMAMFQGAFDQEARGNLPKVWIPILGENRRIQLDRIYELVKPDEICPVLPSPAKDPRRADNLIREYREFLFKEMEIDPRNLVLAAEQNPFEVYRTLREVVLHYHDSFDPLGGCRVALSALSSKLMSLGTLMAAYELKQSGCPIAVAHVESHGYSLGSHTPDSELFGLWLAGECYEH
jgi:hypothetical protein